MVTIYINNIPDAIDDINLTNSSINENLLPGAMVGELRADDQYLSATHNFEFVLGDGDDDNNKFRITDTVKIIAGQGNAGCSFVFETCSSSPGNALNELNHPVGMVKDINGDLLIADQFNHRIMKWKLDEEDSGERIFGTHTVANSSLDRLVQPTDVTVDRYNNLYIADLGNSRILKVSPGSTSGQIIVDGLINNPTSITIDSNENLYVSDNSDKVYKLTESESGIWNSEILISGLNNPTSLEIDDEGNIYIVEQNNHRVLKRDVNTGSLLTVAGGNGMGSNLNQLRYPWGVAVDSEKNIYVTDQNNHRVMKWSPGSSEGILVAGGEGCLESESCIYGVELYPKLYLRNPRGIIIDDDGSLYISEWYNHRVIKIENNKLVTRETFDYETKSSYSVRVKANSSRGYSLEKQLTVSVNNLPDQIVDISLSNYEITENQDEGSLIGYIQVDDQFTEATHTFEFVEGVGSENNFFFDISFSNDGKPIQFRFCL